MPVIQSWFFNIFLYDVLNLSLINLPSLKLLLLLLILRIRVQLSSLNTFFNLKILIHPFHILVLVFIQGHSQTIDVGHYENATTLGTGFGFADVEDCGVFFRLLLSHLSTLNIVPPLILLFLGIFLNIVELCGVHPGLREKVEVFGEFFLEPFQMDGESAFATDVVHSEEVVCFLEGGEAAEEFGRHPTICPKYVPIIRVPNFIYTMLFYFSNWS